MVSARKIETKQKHKKRKKERQMKVTAMSEG